ncbi:MAG: multicopper oxidase domain-containing protein [Beutenbergiaceae bacterium]
MSQTLSDRTRRHLWANAPVLGWLLAVVVVSGIHRSLPEYRWLLVHMLMLGAVTTAIIVWSAHFTDALTRRQASIASRRAQAARVAAISIGTATTAVGITAGIWAVTLIGATIVGGTVAWHAITLALQARAALPSRFGSTIRYYVVAGSLMPVGAVLGVLLARGGSAQLQVAHIAVNILGFVGLTVLGTLVTLWPTMLRTRVDDRAERISRQALLILATGVVLAATGAIIGWRSVLVAGLALYLSGVAVMIRPMVRVARVKSPSAYPTLSVASGLVWLVVALVWLALLAIRADTWDGVVDAAGTITTALTAGFAAQVLLGALTYLIPVVLGGGPATVRATMAELERWGAFRVAITNAGLLFFALPAPSLVLVIASFVALVGLGLFLPLAARALWVARRQRSVPTAGRTSPAEPASPRPVRGPVMAGLAMTAVLVATAVSIDPAVIGGDSAAAGVASTGETVVVQVEARDMRFYPDTVEVAPGTEVIIELTNTDDSQVHDLVLDSGVSSGRLAPGESATIDVGVVGRSTDGWCSIIGHRQMGMLFNIVVTGDDATAQSGDPGEPQPSSGHEGSMPADGSAVDLDLMREPEDGFTARDPVLPPPPSGTTHELTFQVTEQVQEVAPGVTQTLWTFNGTAPGPLLHGKIGDRFIITLVNDGTIGHSVDFHAGALAPDQPMRTIAPGESLTYAFTAERAGIWMYHCSTPPLSAHIANGMFGAVVIEPNDLPEVDREYILVSSEFYLGPEGGEVDTDKVNAEDPDLVVFNGYSRGYDFDQLRVNTGERVRFWVLNAGPNRSLPFHVIGGQFDTVWNEGAYTLRPDDPGGGGSQVLPLMPAQGGFVELVFPEAGHYPFVSHAMVDAERGAHGFVEVTDP